MKRIISYSLIILFVIACSENKISKTEASSLVDTFKGHTYLALWKSKYYPRAWKSLNQIDKALGVITINSVNETKMVNVKFWLADSTLRHIAEKENIFYTKTYFLDTTYNEEITTSNNWFEVMNTVNDTAIFQIKVNELKQTQKELSGKYSFKIHCHFQDQNGVGYDTIFLSRFNSGWMEQ